MRVLVVNDDGIHAKGLRTIAAALKKKHDVTVVAPDSERSAASHAITLQRPLRVSRAYPSELEGIPCYVIDGLPVDCVKIGISHIMKENVDLVVSGINHGYNLGSDIIYSGTVAAALDAVIMGYRGLAISIGSPYPQHIESAAAIAESIIDVELLSAPADGILYNLNVPDLPITEIKGVRAARQGKTVYVDAIEIRSDPRGNDYYWMGGKLVEDEIEDDTDVSLVRHGYAALMPVKYDLTEKTHFNELICKIQKIKLHY